MTEFQTVGEGACNIMYTSTYHLYITVIILVTETTGETVGMLVFQATEPPLTPM